MDETLKTLEIVGLITTLILSPILVKLYDVMVLNKKHEKVNSQQSDVLKEIVKRQNDIEKEILDQMGLLIIENRTNNEIIKDKIKNIENRLDSTADNFNNRFKIIDSELLDINKKINKIEVKINAKE